MRVRVHVCGRLSRDPVCRDIGATRVGLIVGRHQWDLAVTPDARFAQGRLGGWVHHNRSPE